MTTKTKLLDALAKALPELEGAKKNADNPHFKSKYADLGAVIDAVRPIKDHGIWFLQETQEHERGALVETFWIGHGEKLSAGVVYVPAAKDNAHGFGSALTYARRYGLQTAAGLSTEDDDGNAAVDAPPKQRNWGGRYPTKTALKRAMHEHHAELERLGKEARMDDLEAYLTSPEYQDYIRQASEHANVYLEGGPPAPPEFIGAFDLEQRARDMIALRGNQEMEPAQ